MKSKDLSWEAWLLKLGGLGVIGRVSSRIFILGGGGGGGGKLTDQSVQEGVYPLPHEPKIFTNLKLVLNYSL